MAAVSGHKDSTIYCCPYFNLAFPALFSCNVCSGSKPATLPQDLKVLLESKFNPILSNCQIIKRIVIHVSLKSGRKQGRDAPYRLAELEVHKLF